MTAQAGRRLAFAPMRVVAAAAAILSCVVAAQADQFTEKATEAANILQTGQPKAAFEALDAAVESFWTIAPLTIADAYFVSQGDGASKNARRSDAPFAAGERIAVHVAPLGYDFEADSGNFRIAMATDIEIRTPGGIILARSADFGRLEWSGPAKNRTFSGRVNIDLPTLRPGQYELFLTLTDQASGKAANVTLPFAISAE